MTDDGFLNRNKKYLRRILKNCADCKTSFVISKKCFVFLCILFNMYDKKEFRAQHKAHSLLHNFITTHLSVLLLLFYFNFVNNLLLKYRFCIYPNLHKVGRVGSI